MKRYQQTALILLVVSISSVLLPRPSRGQQNWPEFRGPSGQGVSQVQGLPVTWNSKTNITWKKPVVGKGWSSPVYDQRRIYLTTAVPLAGSVEGDQSLRAICLDARTGDTLWDVEVFFQDGETAPRIQSKNSHASATPILHDDKLYVHFGHQGTVCLSLDGKLVWSTRQIHYEPVHGNGGSPIVVDDLLIFNCDGERNPFVVALDLATGKGKWRTGRRVDAKRSFSFSTPLLIRVHDRPLIISPGSALVGAYEPKTGREVWRVRYPEGYSVVPRPVYGQGLVFVCSGYETSILYAIRPDGEGDVTDTHVAWTADRRVPNNASPLLNGNELYLVSDEGVGSCLDARTGQVHWTERFGGNFSASPLLAGGAVYFQNETGTAIVVKAGTKYQRLATNTFEDIPGERTFASYAVGDQALFIRSEKHLFRIESRGS